MKDERRTGGRLPLAARLDITAEESGAYRGAGFVTNLSPGGMAFECTKLFEPGERLQLDFALGEENRFLVSSEVVYRKEGILARAYGARFMRQNPKYIPASRRTFVPGPGHRSNNAMQIIDGKKISQEIRAELKQQVAALKAKGIEPGLATILVGEDPASHVYVANKIKACAELGIRSFHHPMPVSSTEGEVVGLIERLNADARVHGILLQLPLPKSLSPDKALETISPDKDVDGLHPYNIGQLCSAKNWDEMERKRLLMSCTPAGCVLLLKRYGIDIAGKRVVVVGRSTLMGKPVSMMLLANNATVTMAHSGTKDLPGVCREADILVVAIGKPKFVTKEFVKPGAVVLDVGINRVGASLCGDVDYDGVKDVAGYLTPVPGGVGAMTITMLMRNTVMAAER